MSNHHVGFRHYQCATKTFHRTGNLAIGYYCCCCSTCDLNYCVGTVLYYVVRTVHDISCFYSKYGAIISNNYTILNSCLRHDSSIFSFVSFQDTRKRKELLGGCQSLQKNIWTHNL
jgi:hypothetical protein